MHVLDWRIVPHRGTMCLKKGAEMVPADSQRWNRLLLCFPLLTDKGAHLLSLILQASDRGEIRPINVHIDLNVLSNQGRFNYNKLQVLKVLTVCALSP